MSRKEVQGFRRCRRFKGAGFKRCREVQVVREVEWCGSSTECRRVHAMHSIASARCVEPLNPLNLSHPLHLSSLHPHIL
jgi:hypothetical protein